ncbi:hypothetical protein LTS18_000899 [Coniosporium uncinatum]|uniref:Uncharacterized protein n=1 Tax=Coniosporium uncinatum TaxID=93489 RepID=A0ACC3DUL4_9PEZI|nr:hypothetical protein LTS18_000899 [Coniosporium uncinatum]
MPVFSAAVQKIETPNEPYLGQSPAIDDLYKPSAQEHRGIKGVLKDIGSNLRKQNVSQDATQQRDPPKIPNGSRRSLQYQKTDYFGVVRSPRLSTDENDRPRQSSESKRPKMPQLSLDVNQWKKKGDSKRPSKDSGARVEDGCPERQEEAPPTCQA